MRYLSIFILLALFSCSHSAQDEKLLREAELISDSIPMDALTKLQAIKNSKNFSDIDNAKYNTLLTQLLLNTGNKIPSDSLINKAIAYYQETNDSTELFNALFTKANYFYSISKHDSALFYFSKAEDVIPPTSDNDKRIRVKRSSGFSNLYLGNTKEAIKNQQAALDMLSDSNDTIRKIYATMNLAQAYSYDKEIETATQRYEEALQLATEKNDLRLQSAILSQLSNLFAQQNDFKKAMKYKKQEHALRVNRKEIPARNLAQAMLFDKQNMPDSTRYYLELALQGNDNVVADIAYGFLGDWYEKQGLYNESFGAWRNKDETTRHLESGISMASLQHQYESERLKNENNQLKIKQKEKDVILMAILVSVLLLAIVVYFFWMQAKRKRDRERFVHKERQLNNENLLLKKEKEISGLREKEALLRESLFRRITFSDKIPSLQSDESNEKNNRTSSFIRIQLSETDWENLKNSVNETYPNFTQHLHNEYPKLTEDDIRFCCLLKINVNMQDLADIYCVGKAAITKRKYRIKTEKLYLHDSGTDLDTFLQNFY